MEAYESFMSRIESFETREMNIWGNNFESNPSLMKKVDEDNKFCAFYGDTIVFNLNEKTKEILSQMVDELYKKVPECFCERLVSDTFHMTLHDLSNSPNLEEIASEVFENELKVIEMAQQVRTGTIKMKSKCIFNMVNTSLVLGLYPINEEEYLKLMELYKLFNGVKWLNYPLTPHITLAYYNRYGFDMELWRKLAGIVWEMNGQELEIELEVKELFYQKFVSMNEYINVLRLGEV